MKNILYILCVFVIILASCTRPQLVFLNGELIEGTPKEFMERSNYCGVDSANNPIYFPPYDSTGIENVIIVSGIPTDEDVIPFWIYFDTNERGQIKKLRAEAIISEQDIPVAKEKAEMTHAQMEYSLWDGNSEPILYKIYLTYEHK